MNLAAMLIAGLVVLPAVGLVVWTWFVLDQVEEDLRMAIGSRAVAVRSRWL